VNRDRQRPRSGAKSNRLSTLLNVSGVHDTQRVATAVSPGPQRSAGSTSLECGTSVRLQCGSGIQEPARCRLLSHCPCDSDRTRQGFPFGRPLADLDWPSVGPGHGWIRQSGSGDDGPPTRTPT
jgi:hypothetical protein